MNPSVSATHTNMEGMRTIAVIGKIFGNLAVMLPLVLVLINSTNYY
jgi:hypothetical protein